MRRYHLYNNLERRKDISVPVYDCIMRHWKRGDVAQLLAQKRESSVREVKRIVASGDTYLLFSAVDTVVDDVFDHIKRQDLSDLPPIIYREKIDPSSGKVRNIGVESIVQQLYDEVADYAIQPLKRRIGTYQIACLKGKGGALGIRAMKRWMRDKRVRWACQCDIKKCYESTDRVKMMAFLRHIIRGSPRVLWLIETLINTHRRGLNIGCKLSQDLMNIYLSVLYHEMMERTMVVRKRRGREEKHMAVIHTLFQMDDIVLLCVSRKDTEFAFKQLRKIAGKMGITIKGNWRIFRLDAPNTRGRGKSFLDIVGVRFYRGKATLRRRVYIRAQRAFTKAERKRRQHKAIRKKLAQRVISYYGSLKWTDHYKLWSKYKVNRIVRICKEVISNESKIFYKTGQSKDCVDGRQDVCVSVP